MKTVQPTINVTPLIDVLLVLLIIFMVITPAKPTDFKAKIPQPPKMDEAAANPNTLIVQLAADSSLRLNAEEVSGTIDEPEKLIEKLSLIFRERTKKGDFSQNASFKTNTGDNVEIEKTVFIKAPRSISYGKVVKVVDAVKMAGANPISLQIDELN